MLVAVATSIVLLVAVGVAAWYLTRDPGQNTATIGQNNSSSASDPPAATTAPSGSPSQTSTSDDPTGSDILAHRGGDEKYPLQTFESLTSAADDGFAVETDVRWTSDNRAVIIHDEAATRGYGAIGLTKCPRRHGKSSASTAAHSRRRGSLIRLRPTQV